MAIKQTVNQMLSQELNNLEKENKSKDKRIIELEKENDELFLKLESVEYVVEEIDAIGEEAKIFLDKLSVHKRDIKTLVNGKKPRKKKSTKRRSR
jgi:hypothetical protein